MIGDYVHRAKSKSKCQPLWMNRLLLRSSRKKRRIWKQYRETGEREKYMEYKDLEKNIKGEVRRSKKQLEIKLSKMNNKKGFWIT